ncbi:Peptidase C26 [Acididesulfobacillus acetoxydans]|uniref:Peptidase C26 n=1 Tax=Acididesulfobacillus acetoxydans TaxID=1561005 RepID=A0A8S0VYU1_9FIRM|nr:gamma-glutamyl-gamma-aminobutyrate hydrolase family protein [Acididesulfobacillus acetoxydans]CAA7603363.1 Peptidase C26 [Acididesulfobacillus acetoxydans]CEJ09308.1 Peptidase C26 [Acididesulfobacillus acetoxydans]
METTKPLIGINCAFQAEGDRFNDRLHLARIYVQAVEKTGGIPILLPIVENEGSVRAMMDEVDGLLMSGGGGLPAKFTRDQTLPGLAEQNPIRHRFDVQIVKLALERDLPILGICRGHQTVNEVAGGTLHLSLQEKTRQEHRQESPDDQVCHQIRIAENSRLASFMGTTGVGVNSFHRQAVDRLAPGMRAVAWADDGILEAYESDRHLFVLGCQFHPESLMVRDSRFAAIYGAFVQAATQYHDKVSRPGIRTRYHERGH